MAISNYNTDPDLNVDISGINIAEGCPPSGINNAIRQMMADVKTFTDSPTFSGGITVTSGATISGGATVTSGVTADTLTVTSGATISGGGIQVGETPAQPLGTGIEITHSSGGEAYVAVNNGATGSTAHRLVFLTNGYGNGGIYDTTNSRWILNVDATGQPIFTISPEIIRSNPYVTCIKNDLAKGDTVDGTTYQGIHCRDKNKTVLARLEHRYNATKASIIFFEAVNMTSASASGSTCVTVRYRGDNIKEFSPWGNNIINLGASGDRWANTYLASNPNVSSDERLKTSISVVPDAVLDAWAAVQWQQFQMRDAVAEKGENARLHNGLIAQRIDEAFKAHGLDATRYGLFCWDSWEAQPEERDEKGNVTQEARPAGDAYSLRYEEALCMEAAYQRRRADRAEARITSLEQRLAEMEQAIAALAGGTE